MCSSDLILADIQTIDKRLPKVQKEAKANPKKRDELDYLESLKRHLESGTPLSALPSVDQDAIADLHLLTAKPVIYAFNVSEDTISDTAKKEKLAALVAPARSVFICAKLEEELRGLDDADAAELLESYGVQERGLNQLIHAAYDTLGLQSYLTAGPKEVRAWTIHQGDTAPQAAGVIHTDFEKGFIRAEVMKYNDYTTLGSESAVKDAGKFKVEGKEYTPQQYLNDYCKLNMNDYVDITSLGNKPYWTKVEYEVPDNWWHDSSYYNVPLDDYMTIVRNTMRKGYTVLIGGDVSETGFDAWSQVAVVPTYDIPSAYIDDNARIMRFMNGSTTDDHGMHMVGYLRSEEPHV